MNSNVVSGSRPAGFWIRVCATVVDSLVLAPVSLLSVLNLIMFKNLAILMFTYGIIFMYKPFMESFRGATLGKMVCRLKVEDSNGNRLTLSSAYLRFAPFLLANVIGFVNSFRLFVSSDFQSIRTIADFGKWSQADPLRFLGTVASLIVLVDCIFVAFTFRKRALHDKLASSFCVWK